MSDDLCLFSILYTANDVHMTWCFVLILENIPFSPILFIENEYFPILFEKKKQVLDLLSRMILLLKYMVFEFDSGK